MTRSAPSANQSESDTEGEQDQQGSSLRLLLVVPLLLCLLSWSQAAIAQESATDNPAETTTEETETPENLDEEAEERFESMLAEGEEEQQALATEANFPARDQLNFLELLIRGGYFMIPIVFMSLLVAVCGIERWIALRRNRILPRGFVAALEILAAREGGFDPRAGYQLCREYPSTAATVMRAALLKVGRDHSEVEKAVTDSSEREAANLYRNVRPITLAASITPLLGLLGTVWGMILAFFETSQAVGGAKAQDLANGIYTALVTTLAGLIVAIVAAILAHYFEGRIQYLFREIQALIDDLMPQLERYEGKLRMSQVNLDALTPEDLSKNHLSSNDAKAKTSQESAEEAAEADASDARRKSRKSSTKR
ncbi:Biopolymer transport protein ExbB [Planctomycetales bacterium 10988]|nr:Biopolymer transport protein ExbB [Planctomycetales bacterium 10988]